MVQHPGSAGRTTAGALPLDPPPLDEAVSEALQRLRDPEHRFIDEFFWFWPRPGLGSKDPAIVALNTRDVDLAIEIWSDEARAKNDRSRSSHNLAVMFHTLALDIEYARQTEEISKPLEKVQYTYWQKGLSQWQAVLADDEFWDQVSSRVLELNDPRLTTDWSRRIRTALPLVVLLINAQIVCRAATAGANAEARKYWSLIGESGFSEADVAEACGRSARGIREVVSAICRTAEQEAEAEPATADESARRMLQETKPLLCALDMLIAGGVTLADEVRDEVATAATNCLYLLSDQAGKSEVARKLLELTRPYAISLSIRERIDYLNAEFLRSAYRS